MRSCCHSLCFSVRHAYSPHQPSFLAAFNTTRFEPCDQSVSWFSLLSISCAQGQTGFADPEIYSFYQFQKHVGRYFSIIFFSLPPFSSVSGDFSCGYVGPLKMIKELTNGLFIKYFICAFHFGQFFLLCLQIHSFFFCSVKSAVNPPSVFSSQILYSSRIEV